MNKVFFTPGPTHLHPAAKDIFAGAIEAGICSISHRSAAFEMIFARTVQRLKQLMSIPKGAEIFFLGSATEAMERVIQNCVSKTSYHFVNGAFADRFYKIAQELGRKPQMKDCPWGRGFDLSEAEIPREAELLCITQNETSTGVYIPPKDIADLKAQYPGKYLAVDVVSSAPYVPLDFSKVDCAFFSIQKGFCLPAGMGVLIVNPKLMEHSLELAKRSDLSIGSYHSFPELRKYAMSNQTPETPNVLAIYMLGEILQIYLDRGMQEIETQTLEKATRLYTFLESTRTMRPFVRDARFRSPTVISVECQAARKVRQVLSGLGMELGAGYAHYKETQFRIANFPCHTLEMVESLIAKLAEIDEELAEAAGLK